MTQQFSSQIDNELPEVTNDTVQQSQKQYVKKQYVKKQYVKKQYVKKYVKSELFRIS